jgi:ribosomal protein S12 methylthiotransferase accessory factor
MLTHPRLKYNYHAEFLDDDKILLSSEKDNALLTGKAYSLVLSAIHRDGPALEELTAALEGRLSEFEIYYALDVLEKQGYITEAAPTLPQESRAYWNSLGIEVNSLLEVLADKTVSIEWIGLPAADAFLHALAAIGVKTSETGELKIIVTDDYQRKELRPINREALRTKQPWMLLKPVGVEPWLGPVFLPGKTGCWECLEQRLGINRPINAFHKTQKNTQDNLPIPAAYVPPSLQAAANLAALEIAKWLYNGENERLQGKLVTFDYQTLTSQSHLLVKRPQCKACGEPGDKRREPAPIDPERKSSYCVSTAGGYREVPPEDTLEKYRHHVSPITGVVQYLKPYHSIKGSPVYNYSSGCNTALHSKTMYWLNSHIRSANGGKGKTWAQAKAGALCEAIERYSLTYQGDEPYITASLKQLNSDGIHPNACMNFSDTQYRNREEINRTCSKFYALVPVPFDESLEMNWTPVYSLGHQKFKYLPSCFCYAQYPSEDESTLFSYPDSSGCAAGNTLEEAILQGFLELVERDSVALWWYNMLEKPALDLLSFNEPYFLRLIEYYKSLGRGLYVLDLTADLQIPAFAAISYKPGDKKENNKENIIFGFGAHVDARIAVERALIELNQILPITGGDGTDETKGTYLTQDKIFVDWLDQATLENQPYLAAPANMPVKKAADYPPLCKPRIYDSLDFCLEAAASRGLETLVLDMTRQDVGLPVVKVMIPGMRHFWKRLAPGRLYDVPVKLDLLDIPLKEEETNPVGLFI